MNSQMSLADQAIEALSMVKSMGEDIGNDDPERHIVRNLKRLAEQNLEASFRLAIDLAQQAKQVSKDFAQALMDQAAKVET